MVDLCDARPRGLIAVSSQVEEEIKFCHDLQMPHGYHSAVGQNLQGLYQGHSFTGKYELVLGLL